MKKFLALLCALSMMAMVTGCGDDDSSSKKESGTESVSEESSEEESSEEESSEEESSEEESSEEESSEEESSAASGADGIAALDTEATFGDLTFMVPGEWDATVTDAMAVYMLPSQTGSFIVQSVSAESLGMEVPEGADMESALQEEFAAIDTYVTDSMEASGATVLADEWDTVNGTDAYGVSFTVESAGVPTSNVSIYFCVGSSMYVAVFCGMNGDVEILDYVDPVMDSITF